MKNKLYTVILATMLFAINAEAHDPSKHKKANAEKPRCEAMKNMDHSKIDVNDPVMMAMMKQCQADNKQPDEKVNHHDKKSDAKKAHDH